jgi:predicted permease
MGVVVLILLIACVNLANLTLARAATRSHVSTRAALGASRRQIVWQLLTESLLLSAAGALLALAVAHWGSPLLVSLITQGTSDPVILDLRPDWRVFAFAAAAAILTGALIGLVPAWQMSRQEPALVLRHRGAGRGTGRSGKLLIVAQIALSLVLLFGAGLLLRTFENLRSSDPGFRKTGVLEAAVRLQPAADNNGPDTNSYRRQLVERAAALPGAISAAFSDLPVPAGEQGWKETVSPSGADGNSEINLLATLAAVSPGFFKTLAIPFVSGRDFDWSDDRRHSPIAIVDAQVARRLFPSGDALGKRVRFGVQAEFQNLEIVGVVRPARLIDLRDPDQYLIYVPCPQHSQYDEGSLFIRANRPAALVRTLDSQVRSLGREYVTESKTIEQMSDQTLAAERATAILSSAFAAAALLLAGIGLFGLMSYTVTRRTREIGIRMALGSQTGAILRMILGETLLLTLAGIALGVPCALEATRFIAHTLFGLSPVDPLTLAAASLGLFAVAAIAGYLPARRTLKSDPMAALRCD